MRLRVRVRTGLLLVGGAALLLLYAFVDGPSVKPGVPARRLQIARITADDIAKTVGNIGPSLPILHDSKRPPPPQPPILAAPAALSPHQPPFPAAPPALHHPATAGNLHYDVSDTVTHHHDATTASNTSSQAPPAVLVNKQSLSGVYTKEMELIAMASFKSISIDKRKKLLMYLNHLSDEQFNEIYKSVVGSEPTDVENSGEDDGLTHLLTENTPDPERTTDRPGGQKTVAEQNAKASDAASEHTRASDTAAEHPLITDAVAERVQAKEAAAKRSRTTKAPTRVSKSGNKLKGGPRYISENQKGYAARVVVESVTLPSGYSPSPEVDQRLAARRSHVREVCHKYHLDEVSPSNTINAWEFLINPKHKLVWCSVFKAASSTWFYNFNVLAGYSENRLLRAKETPITLARKKYPRPTASELVNFMNQTERPLSFMIARHPLHRLVSGYRDKLLSGRRYYSNLSRRIVLSYPHLGTKNLVETAVSNPHDIRNNPDSMLNKALSKVKRARMIVVPTFPQFVQYLIDATKKGESLDEHWTPMNKFCSPCLFEFDVIAKMETLDEDGNYIIFQSGIENIVKPKRINRNKNAPTDEVAASFLCQLSRRMMMDLIDLYKMDLELFEYQYEQYINCTTDKVRLEKVH